MKTLDRYIFREIFFPSVIALAALTFVAFLAFSREIGWLLELIVRQSATISDTSISNSVLPMSPGWTDIATHFGFIMLLQQCTRGPSTAIYHW